MTHTPIPIIRSRRFVAVLTGFLLACCTLAAATAATASSPLRAGLGYRLADGDFVGNYLTGSGQKVYCLDPQAAEPATVSLTSMGRYPGASAAVTAELAYALSTWGDAGTARQGAVESQVLNTLVGNRADVRRRAAALPAALKATVASHVAAARAFHGPYFLRLRLPRALAPGQSAIGTVRVVSFGGRLIPRLGISLVHSADSAAPATVRTDARGVARFRYAATNVGEISIAATATDLPSASILASHPQPGQQHLVGAARTVGVSGSARVSRQAGGFSHRYACTSTCNGRPMATLRACAPASRFDSRVVFDLSGHRRVLAFPRSATRVCRTLHLKLRDGERVRASRQYRTAHGWSRRVHLRGGFVVDCPPVPAVGVSVVYSCASASVRIALAAYNPRGAWIPLVNRSSHRMVLRIGGATSRQIVANPGQTAQFRARASCSEPVTYTTQAAVQRSNGAYNVGAIASVTTPHPAG